MTEPRTVLVTGGANGIGAAMVRRFTSAGNHVAVADLDQVNGEGLAEETGCLFVRTDVGSRTDNQAAIDETVARFGRLDVVCLNAGVPGGAAIGAEFDVEQYHRGMRINLDGVVYGANAAIPHLRGPGGAILITSSLAGITASPDLYYATAKHALIGLTRSLALLLGPNAITVNALCPGFIDTPLLAKHRDLFVQHGVAIADPDHVAHAAQHILDSGETGLAWDVQAGRPATPVEFPAVTLSMTAR